MQALCRFYCLYRKSVVRNDVAQLLDAALIRSCGEPGINDFTDAEQVTAVQSAGWLD